MGRRAAASAWAIGTAALLVAAGNVVWAPPALAAPTTITTDPGWAAGCQPENEWIFVIDQVAGSTGVEPPASITAGLVGGGTVEIPVTEVVGDPEQPDQFPRNRASYVLTATEKLTGVATAVVDDAWEPGGFGFGLLSGPCYYPDITIALASRVVMVGETLTATGEVRSPDGEPLAGRDLIVRVFAGHSMGSGGLVFHPRTGPDGRYEVSTPATGIGWYQFVVEMRESSPGTGFGEFGNELLPLAGWALPPSVPAGDGPLESSAGTTFARTTVLRGGGFSSEAPVAIVAYPGPSLITIAMADYDGLLEVEVTMPDGLEGPHTLVAAGHDSGGTQFLTLPVNIQGGGGGGELPVTGSAVGTVAGAGAALLGLGFLAVLVARRRRTRFTAG